MLIFTIPDFFEQLSTICKRIIIDLLSTTLVPNVELQKIQKWDYMNTFNKPLICQKKKQHCVSKAIQYVDCQNNDNIRDGIRNVYTMWTQSEVGFCIN